MSTRQVERLTALLARVQRNRAEPRGANGTELGESAPVTGQRLRPEPAMAAAPVSAASHAVPPPSFSAAAPSARTKAAPTPLEMALEGRASRQPEPPPRAEPASPPVQPAARAAAPAAPAPQATAAEGRVLAEPNTAEPTKPIVQVVSKQPPHAASSFGELLRRSLSLRPR